MPAQALKVDRLRKLLHGKGLPFRRFMEAALYDPHFGYYTGPRNPIGKSGDYVTGPTLSPLFSYALGRLIREFVGRAGDEMSTVVDIGCGDGSLIHSLWAERGASRQIGFYGVDRSLSRVPDGEGPHFTTDLAEVPRDGTHLLIANELFDAFPFARLVKRDERLCELWVREIAGELEWAEEEAPPEYAGYFGKRGIVLRDGQFADVSLEWESAYVELCRFMHRGLLVTLDYGFPETNLFDARVRRFGTAASYRGHRLSGDLLADPGERDLTAHINFTDLIRAGEQEGLQTLYFDRQAKFLLALGAAEHELLRPIDQVGARSLEDGLEALDRRHDARRLLLPDGIGEEIRVLVQAKGFDASGWSFQRPIFHR